MKRIIGVCHLLPLPGSPRYGGSLRRVIERAERDAKALRGVDAIIVENYGDAPFLPDRVEPVTVAALTRVAEVVRAAARVPIGINLLRNDAVGALAIATAVEAEFIRVNVLTGVSAAGEGVLIGEAHRVLRARARWNSKAAIWADVRVKHAAPLGIQDPEVLAREAADRGGADALIVTGTATGRPPDPDSVEAVRRAVPRLPLYVGSGLTERNAESLLRSADGAIVGSAFKRGGRAENPVDPRRVRRFLAHVRRLGSAGI